MSSKNGKRRLAVDVDAEEQGSAKKNKLPDKQHPFFSNSAARKRESLLPDSEKSTVKLDAPPTVEHWLHLDPFATLPTDSSTSTSTKKIKIAMYDLDGTLIKPASGVKFPKNAEDWKPWDHTVKPKLAEAHEQGFHLVIISNQNLREKALAEWRKKVPDITPGIPVRVLAAKAKDQYRKPGIGLYEFLINLYQAKGLEIDYEKSFYVGDAAGRTGDHNDTDRKFAVNAGLIFYTPEQYFKYVVMVLPSVLPQLSNDPYPREDKTPPVYAGFKGFDAAAELERMQDLPLVTPTNAPIIPTNTKEIVVFVGYPASGKTSFYNKYFKPHDYVHVNQDTLRSRDKCLAVVRETITFGKTGCVVDNTNRDAATRSLYVAMAKQLGVPIRCFFFTAFYNLAKHNNHYRAWYAKNAPEAERRSILPETAFIGFKNARQEPDDREGFDEIRRVNFAFDGTEEDRKIWTKWMW
ncbi:DNA kinase/phosphatase Pnk1, variant 2 [Naganishia albida]|nr:DNA kinase/phosphatase Pnk1, variant 2 [Naganishia albida]